MNKNNQARKTNNSSIFGLFIILFGILLLIDNIIPGLYFFNRIFSWPIILIAVGLFLGYRSGYDKPAPLILILIGAFFFILNIFNVGFNVLFWPVIFIAVGFYIISGRSRKKHFRPEPSPSPNQPIWDKRVYQDKENPMNVPPQADNTYTEYTDIPNDRKEGSSTESNAQQNFHQQDSSNGNKQEYSQKSHVREEYVDCTSVFGSNKITVFSQNFKGGNVINIFGGTEINLMHADIKEPVELEVIQLFGGCKIIAPAHWIIQSEMASIFGGIEDKRFTQAIPDNTKVIYIRGTSLFGGLTIKSV